MAQTVAIKTCSKCGRGFPATPEHFYRQGLGLRPDCKECRSSSRAAHYQANKDRVGAQVKSWREANKEKRQDYEKEYREANKIKIQLRSLDWQKVNPDRCRDIQRRWRKANPEKLRAYEHKRRAREVVAGGSFSASDIKNLYRLQNGRCPYCQISIESGYHIDHFIPLVLGGTNSITNLVLACPSCNLSKGAKHPEEWFEWHRSSQEIL